MTTSVNEANHFPKIRDGRLTGEVISSSNVPWRRSSAKWRMVSIGKRNNSATAKFPTITRREASPEMEMPRKKNSPAKNRKTARKT
jgi:hypothetical protein